MKYIRKNYVSPHFTKGGTGITNFDKKDLPICLAALAKYNRGNCFVSFRPMADKVWPNLYSLHSSVRDLSDFWKVYWKVKGVKY